MDNTKILLLDRFMRGETSPEEEQQLLAWFREVDSQEDILTFYRQRWHESATKEISEEVQLRMFNQIRDRINTDKTVLQKNDRKQNRRRLLRWGQYAAAVILCVVVGITSHLLYTRQSMAEVKEYMVEAEKGQRASVTLPDGTKVWLNSHTQIIYNSNYGVEDRVVDLRGEAYFEVKKDAKKPFIVDVASMQIKVLGTSFNVNAYPTESKVLTTLDEGSVKIRNAQSNSFDYIMKPGETAIYEKETGTCIIQKNKDYKNESVWMKDVLIFNDTPLEDVLKVLSRKYNVQFNIENEAIYSYTYTLRSEGESLQEILESMRHITPIKYEKTNRREIKISPR